jgi:hypothetical protein
VTELTVVIFFVHAAVLSIKTAFNLVKNTFIIPYYTIDSVKRNVLSSMFKSFLGTAIQQSKEKEQKDQQ